MNDYTVYISWGGDNIFRVATPSRGIDHREAAKNRVASLLNPDQYDDVLVLPTNDYSVLSGVAKIFPVSEFLDKPTPTGGRKRRYGWP